MNGFDPYMPLKGSYFYQTGPTHWKIATAEKLTAMLANDPPEFRTVLGIVEEVDEESAPVGGWHTLGPMYFDLDAPDIDEAIEGFHRLLAKLQGLELDLHMCRLFLSGVKGVHIEIPMECFVPEIPEEGIKGLARIYHEMAHALYVDTVDLRVFSCGKGRQWRTPNRQREGGTFKVPLTVSEALNLTPESYAKLVSSPRAFPALTAPELCTALSLIYDRARVKAEVRDAKLRGKCEASVLAQAIKSRFGSTLPPVIAALCRGEFPASRGWNYVCIQLATLAHSLSMDVDVLVEACKGLIQSHESDGHKYETPRKRERELRHMFSYTCGQAGYDVSIGGLRSILPQGLRCSDFRGL